MTETVRALVAKYGISEATARRWKAKGIPARYRAPEWQIPERLEPLPPSIPPDHGLTRTQFIRQPSPASPITPLHLVKLQLAYGANERWRSPRSMTDDIEIYPVFAISVPSGGYSCLGVTVRTVSHALFYWANVLVPYERLILDHTTHKHVRRITLAELRAGPGVAGTISSMSSLEIAGQLHEEIKRASAMSYFPINDQDPWHWRPLAWKARQDTSRAGEPVDFRESFGPSTIANGKPLAERARAYYSRPYELKVDGLVGKFTYKPHDFIRGDSDSGVRGGTALKGRAPDRPSTMLAEEVAAETAASEDLKSAPDRDQARYQAVRAAQKEDQSIGDSLVSWDRKTKRFYDPSADARYREDKFIAEKKKRRPQSEPKWGVRDRLASVSIEDTPDALRAEDDRIVAEWLAQQRKISKDAVADWHPRHREIPYTPLPPTDTDAFRPCLNCATTPIKCTARRCPSHADLRQAAE